MIGQSQVTDPLMTALRTNRVNHAYLFSGPRGCGKTTSARILARCLNCVEGPTDTPCGVCPSCIELSRDGGGSLDVVEIDAASHNGVDDARDIRERAVFAPARDRYKIFILDEAHMVTPQGFNALLKIVEEPPEHIKFIFATTEPDKVIGTIRSRTHHYPFRLVPPAQMLDYVQLMCDNEKMSVAPGVLPLVVRAGGGSPRDTLSLLDQLIAGSDADSVSYERAVALLGYTHAALLDEVVEAISMRDSAAAFGAVDRVIQTGQDPRRFVEDLLERLRDLIVVAATNENASVVLRGIPQDELDRMASQASSFGQAALSRTADIVNAALTEMTGATSPRLHLELMIARTLISSHDTSEQGLAARLERLERRIGVVDGPGADRGTAPSVAAPDSVSAASTQTASTQAAPTQTAPTQAAPVTSAATRSAPAEGHAAAPAAPSASAPSASASTAPAETPSADSRSAKVASAEATSAEATRAPAAAATAVGPVTVQQLRDAWPQVLEVVQKTKRGAWMVLSTAHVRELRESDVLVLAFPSQRDVEGLKQRSKPGDGIGDLLKSAVQQVLGFQPKLVAVVDRDGSAAASAADVPAAVPEPPATDAKADMTKGFEPPAQQAHSQPATRTPAAGASTGAAPAGGLRTQTMASWDVVAIPQPGSAQSDTVHPDPAHTDTVHPDPAHTVPARPQTPSVATTPAGSTLPEAPAETKASGNPRDSSRPAPSPAEADDAWPVSDDDAPYEPWADNPGERAHDSAHEVTGAPAAAAPAPVSAAQAAPAADQASGRAVNPAPNAQRQRYGESVVREILGATFLEEQTVERDQADRGFTGFSPGGG